MDFEMNSAPEICVLCCSPALIRDDDNKNVDKATFLVEQIIPSQSLIPDEHSQFLEQSYRLKFCKLCLRLLAKGQKLVEKIAKLEAELGQVKIQVKRSVAESVLVKMEEGLEEDEYYETMELYGNIREQLLVDYNDDLKDGEGNAELPTWSEFNCLDNADYEGEEHVEDANLFGSDPLELTSTLPKSKSSSRKRKAGKDNTKQQSTEQSNKNKNQEPLEPHSSAFLEDNETFHNVERREVMSTYSKRVPKFQPLDTVRNRPMPPRPINVGMCALTRRGSYPRVETPLVAPELSQPHKVKSNQSVPSTPSPSDENEDTMNKALPTPSTLPINDDEKSHAEIDEIRKLPDPLCTTSVEGRAHPCIICPDEFSSAKDAKLHRKFIHPGLAACVSPVPGLQCGRIFKSRDIQRHKKEGHPLLKCPNCVNQAFTTKEKLVLHVNEVHCREFSTGINQLPPPLPDFGYDMKLIPWVHPLSKEEISEVTFGKGVRSLQIILERVKIDNPTQAADASSEKESNKSQNLNENEVVTPAGDSCDNTNKKSPATAISTSILSPSNVPLQKSNPNISNIPVEATAETKEKLAPHPPKRKKILYNCGVCNTKFLAQSELLDHLQTAHGSKPQFACIVCQHQFDSLDECQSHVFAEHPGASATKNPRKGNKAAPATSNSITKAKRSPRGIASDQEKINREFPFWCKVCRLRFSNLEVLQGHLRSEAHSLAVQHGPETPCPYQWCNYNYRGEEDLAAHCETVHSGGDPDPMTFKCPDCRLVSVTYKNEYNLVRHRIKMHGYIPSESLPPPPMHRCPNCERTFHKRVLLMDHMRVSGDCEEAKRCPRCKKLFKSVQTMRHHVKYVHDKTPGDFVCDVCSKRCICAWKLAEHRAIHEEERRYLCSECGKTFKTRNSLTIHKYSHDPDRWTKHYPYRILVQRRLETQKKRDQQKARRSSRSKKRCRKELNLITSSLASSGTEEANQLVDNVMPQSDVVGASLGVGTGVSVFGNFTNGA